MRFKRVGGVSNRRYGFYEREDVALFLDAPEEKSFILYDASSDDKELMHVVRRFAEAGLEKF